MVVDLDRYVYINKLHVMYVCMYGAFCFLYKYPLVLDFYLQRMPLSQSITTCYELHLPLCLIIPVLLLLLNARTALGVARVRVHLEKVVEFNRLFGVF
jgi:hypothetical protein